jgi:hypothetical protein
MNDQETAQQISDIMNELQQLIAELDNEDSNEKLIAELDIACEYLKTALKLISK